MMIFRKRYSDESMYDLSNDMADLFYEEAYLELPEEDGFKTGTFNETVTCEED